MKAQSERRAEGRPRLHRRQGRFHRLPRRAAAPRSSTPRPASRSTPPSSSSWRWYDNEWGYSSKVLEMVRVVASAADEGPSTARARSRRPLAGKRVFIRADLNVPQDDAGSITEDTRIRASVPCIQHGAGGRRGGDGHLAPGPPDRRRVQARGFAGAGRQAPGRTARPRRCRWSPNWVDGVDVQPGEVVLLENCRVNKGEKKNDEALARKMAALCDIFVNDAFGTAHRAEATTYGIAQFAQGRLRRPAAGGRDRRDRQGAGQPEAAAGGDRRRLARSSTKLTILQSAGRRRSTS